MSALNNPPYTSLTADVFYGWPLTLLHATAEILYINHIFCLQFTNCVRLMEVVLVLQATRPLRGAV